MSPDLIFAYPCKIGRGVIFLLNFIVQLRGEHGTKGGEKKAKIQDTSLILSAINLSYLSWKRNVSSCRLHCGLFYYFYPVYYSLSIPFSYLWVKLRSVEFCVRSLLKTKLFCVPHKWDPVHGVCKERKKRSETSVVVWQMTRQRNLTVYDCGCVISAPFHPPFHCSSVLTIVNAVFPMHLWLEGRAAVHLVHMAGFALKISCHTVAWIHLAVVYVYVHQPVCG